MDFLFGLLYCLISGMLLLAPAAMVGCLLVLILNRLYRGSNRDR